MAIYFSYKNDSIKRKFAKKNHIKSWINYIIEKKFKKLVGEISIYFTDDDEILEINKKFLKHNYFTDVITFGYCTENTISGDIVISIDTIKSNSLLYGVTFENELHRVIIHGILHLLGLDDNDDAHRKEMKEKENWALNIFYEKWK